ncbi:MAG: hypothetical protein COT85_07435 [Chlamydiae bacterium CG10_big_fil_rev_8_21_14_0_10_42_34]|nr:MAG: hypothetical protein COT85_07435 [Chlamydiae bacterium CG10_big_fil_rev_8_21_14_0_10_42_34]
MVYGGFMDGKKALILVTAAVAIALFTIAAMNHFSHKSDVIEIKVDKAPTMGKSSAMVDIVLIEDFQCRNCRTFSRKVIPKIKSEYIKTGKARFTLVPVSFLAGSQAIANATMEVYHQSPDRFFPYLEEILNYELDVNAKDLIRLARRVGGIDLDKLHDSIVKGAHNEELRKNLSWAQGIMGARFRTPTLYINGSMGSTYSFEAIKDQIEQILGQQ